MSRQFALVCALMLTGLLNSVATRADTLQQIYDLATANDPDYQAAQAAVKSGEQARPIGRSGLLPNLSVDVTGQYNKDIGNRSTNSTMTGNGSTDAVTTGYSAALNQTLFNMNNWYSYKQGDIQANQAEYRWQLAQQDLILRTVTSYLNVLSAIDDMENTEAEKASIKSQLDQTQQRYDVGLVAITDVLEAQASYDNILATEYQTRGNLNIAFEQLTILTGQQHPNIAPLMDDFPIQAPNPPTAQEWVQLALKNSQNLEVAKLSRDSAQISAKASWTPYLPTLNGRVTYGGDFDHKPGTPDDSGAVTIALDVPIAVFTGGGTSARRKQAYYNLDEAKANLLSVQRKLEQSVRTEHLTVTSDINQVKARLQAIKSAQSALEATQAGYQVGTRNLVDVLIAQQNLYQAKLNYSNSRYAYINSMFSLKATAGTLSPDDVAQLNRWLDASGQIARSQYQ